MRKWRRDRDVPPSIDFKRLIWRWDTARWKGKEKMQDALWADATVQEVDEDQGEVSGKRCKRYQINRNREPANVKTVQVRKPRKQRWAQFVENPGNPLRRRKEFSEGRRWSPSPEKPWRRKPGSQASASGLLLWTWGPKGRLRKGWAVRRGMQ